jgi:predicted nucleic acid-binding Zn ribbon protein
MFRKKPKSIGELLNQVMREEGFEVPLNQKRVLDSWDEITGKIVSKYTENKFIKNQTLFVKISNPALRSDLTMMKAKFIKELNSKVGSFVIADIRFY